jgi:hypothetical protein
MKYVKSSDLRSPQSGGERSCFAANMNHTMNRIARGLLTLALAAVVLSFFSGCSSLEKGWKRMGERTDTRAREFVAQD